MIRRRSALPLLAILLLAPAAAPLVVAAAETHSATATTLPPAPAGFALGGDPTRGAAAFAKRCAMCHGERGDGVSARAATLRPPPRDLTDPAVQRELDDWALYLVIRDGAQVVGRSKTMFGWGKLVADGEIRDLAAYVRTLDRSATKP